jgi:hypothetical protein
MPNISHNAVFIDAAPVRSSLLCVQAEILVGLDIRLIPVLPAGSAAVELAQNVNIACAIQAP